MSRPSIQLPARRGGIASGLAAASASASVAHADALPGFALAFGEQPVHAEPVPSDTLDVRSLELIGTRSSEVAVPVEPLATAHGNVSAAPLLDALESGVAAALGAVQSVDPAVGVGVVVLGAALLFAMRRGRGGSARTPADDTPVLEALPDAVALFDPQGRLASVNSRLLKLFPVEVSRAQLADSTTSDLYAQLSPDNLAIERSRNRARAGASDPDATISFEVPSYGRRAFLVKERPTGNGGTAVSVYPSPARPATENDPLTALPNRTRLVKVLAERCARTEHRLALLIVDLRGFRQINDSYGRTTGDELLKQTAITLQHSMPDTAFIARTAGDEFAVLLEFAGSERDIERRVYGFLASLRQGLDVGPMNVPVRASVGIAYAPEHGSTVSALLTSADSACAHAKHLGNNRHVVYNSLRQQEAKRRHQLEMGLQRAIERDELSLQYQPQVDVRTNLTCGMEALLRWNSPEFGRVSPADFIPIAEQTGIITRVGAWVLERAIADYQRLSRFGMSPPMLSVNLSSKQFDEGSLVSDIAQLLERTSFDPSKLCLEITETALLSDAASMRRVLTELADMGIALAIDDFGVGYSSLLELRDFPIAEVKIDRAFVSDIVENAASQDIVSAIVDIARSIGAEVVAEGIENAEQFEVIKRLGCDRAQGYWLCMPMAATTFPDVMLGA